MNKTLPEPIATYFRAKGDGEIDEILSCFSPTAVIHDTGENMELTGHDAIRKWLTGTIASYKLTTDVTKFEEKDGQTVVTALVSGDFPGSPIEFDYDFTVQGNKIDALVIR